MKRQRRHRAEARRREKFGVKRGLWLENRIKRLRREWKLQNVQSRVPLRLGWRRGGTDEELFGRTLACPNQYFGGEGGETGLKFWALDWELIERRVREC